MTTLYVFHPWIEASETGATVLSVYGQWWDGDAAGSENSHYYYATIAAAVA